MGKAFFVDIETSSGPRAVPRAAAVHSVSLIFKVSVLRGYVDELRPACRMRERRDGAGAWSATATAAALRGSCPTAREHPSIGSWTWRDNDKWGGIAIVRATAGREEV